MFRIPAQTVTGFFDSKERVGGREAGRQGREYLIFFQRVVRRSVAFLRREEIGGWVQSLLLATLGMEEEDEDRRRVAFLCPGKRSTT